ncbi:MAG: phosphoglyceromutase, partial [Candidatus Marinimicrobia bacterium]|nr:phosphoglyceromutase [Candidatus Neomarinimicrobiota bacterium]
MKKLFLVLIIFAGCEKESNSNPKGLKTENVILITLDGVRWEDLFYGADEKIVLDTLFVKDVEATSAKFWSEDYRERRKLVFPFFWNTIGEQGQIYGNKEQGSVMRLTNPYFFSYPGYNELLVGFNDDSVNSNDKVLNPNINILEFMNEKDGFKGRVAAFASWDVFDWIINNERNDFTI